MSGDLRVLVLLNLHASKSQRVSSMTPGNLLTKQTMRGQGQAATLSGSVSAAFLRNDCRTCSHRATRWLLMPLYCTEAVIRAAHRLVAQYAWRATVACTYPGANVIREPQAVPVQLREHTLFHTHPGHGLPAACCADGTRECCNCCTLVMVKLLLSMNICTLCSMHAGEHTERTCRR